MTATAGVQTDWCPNFAVITPGVRIQLKLTKSTGPYAVAVLLQVPELGINTFESFAAQGFYSGAFRFEDLKLYCVKYAGPHGVALRLEWGAAKWIVNGVEISDSGPDFYINPNRIAPSSIPLIGIPARLGTEVLIPIPVVECPMPPGPGIPASLSASGSVAAVGAWRFKFPGDSEWTLPPVSLSVQPVQAQGCAPGVEGILGGASIGTISSEAHCDAAYTIDSGGGGSLEWNHKSGTVFAIPNLPRSVKRLNPDYATMILRQGLKGCQRNASSYSNGYCGGEPDWWSAQDIPVPAASTILAVIGNQAHALEAPLSQALHTLYTCNAGHMDAEWAGGANPDGCTGTSWSQMLGANVGASGMGEHLDHVSEVANYIDYTCSPHWSMLHFFPPDSDESINCWPVDSDPAPPSLYWIPGRTQWLWNNNLPPSESRKSRTDLVSAPLLESGLNGLFMEFWGQYTSPWGIHRFIAQQVDLPVSRLGNTEDLWAFVDATAVFGGASITLTPTGAPAEIRASLTLTSFDFEPYFLLALAKRFAVDWSGGGVTSVAVNLIGQDGAVLAIATAPGTYGWPKARPFVDYAGSWAQPFMASWPGAVGDFGVDDLGNGVSLATMADPERVHDFKLLMARGAEVLEFVFQLSSAANVDLPYPEFFLPAPPSDLPVVLPETGMSAAILYPQGPGARHGQWQFWNYGTDTFLNPPLVQDWGQKNSALDWLSYRRTMLEGIAPDDGLTAELATLYDATEGQAQVDAAYDTLSFLTEAASKLTGVLVNSMAELPPMCAVPGRARNSAMEAVGGAALETWDYSHEPRYLIAPFRAGVFPPSGSEWTSPGGPIVAGWSIVRHAHAVENDEILTHKVTQQAVEYASVSPWHGYFATLNGAPEGSGPWQVQDERGRLHIASVVDGDVLYQRADSTVPLPAWALEGTVTALGDVVQVAMAIDAWTRRIMMLVTRFAAGDYDLWSCYSDDGGATFSAPVLFMADARAGVPWADGKGSTGYTWFEYDAGTSGPGTQKGSYRGPGDVSFSASYDMVDPAGNPIAVADEGWSNVVRAQDNQMRFTWAPILDGETSPSLWQSFDRRAESWERVV